MCFRFVDDVDRGLDAAGNMRADVALLNQTVAGGKPVLRVYTWRRPALSLGRFQPLDDVDRAACDRDAVEVVRRPTGGRALLHGGDLTYAVAMRRPAGRGGRVDALYRWIATGLVAGLTRLGVDAAVAHQDGDPGAVCFAGQQGSDLRVGARKLCGSAQVHRDGAVLQHGSVLCTRLPFDETQLLRFRDPADRARALDRLATGTVTLSELGAPSDARAVADAIRSGLADAHGVVFEAAAAAFR